jgi:squalene-associated FAD-dependent desaturase
MPMKSVIVIGGGFAGLSAATALAKEGHRVTLLEGRQVLGGRAYSFVDPATGDSVDNGQHLFMGCYVETLKFLQRIGSLGALTFQPSLFIRFVGTGIRRATLRCLSLPAPWHLYSGLLGLKTLSWGDRWRLRNVHTELKKNTPAQELDRLTVDEWLKRCGQSERARRHLWDLITIACLNEDPRIASAATFVAVLKQAFFGDVNSSQLAFANVGLTDMYVKQAVSCIESAGGEIRTRCPVQRLDVRNGRVQGVVLRSGGRLEADAVIAAVPPWALLKVVPQEWVEREPYFAKLGLLTYAPIISIHLWFDRAITDELFVGLLDTHIQWLFNRSRIHHDSKTKAGHVSLVISGAHRFIDWTDKKILTMALEELKRLFPEAGKAALLRSLVIKENHATLSPKVGTESLRPAWESPIKNFWVAGDWTDTGLPGTIESACLSGHRCAELFDSSFRRKPESMMDPGLRPAGMTIEEVASRA